MSAAKGGSSDMIELVYFPVRGRAEPMRLCLIAAKKEYKDVKVEGWPNTKSDTPYGLLPYIIYKGKKYGESKALASFIARECKMAGKTSVDAMRVDEIYSLYICLLEAVAGVHFENDETKKAELKKTLDEETIPRYLQYFEEKINEGEKPGFCIGSSLTLADMAIYNITDTIGKANPKALEGFPGIEQCRTNVKANQDVKTYLVNRQPDTPL